MAIKKISEFTEITSLDDNDLFLIERNGEAKYSKAVSLKKYFGSEEQDASITFVNNKLTLNMPTDSGIAADESASYLRYITFSYSGIFNALNSGTTYSLKVDGVEYTYTEESSPELESFFRVIKNDSNLNIQACKTSTQSVTLLMGSESDNISVMYVNEEIGEQMIAPTWLPSSFPHTVELTVY